MPRSETGGRHIPPIRKAAFSVVVFLNSLFPARSQPKPKGLGSAARASPARANQTAAAGAAARHPLARGAPRDAPTSPLPPGPTRQRDETRRDGDGQVGAAHAELATHLTLHPFSSSPPRAVVVLAFL
ncbi:unnamed protein product [Urochloa humidicola]